MFSTYKNYKTHTLEDCVKERAYFFWLNGSHDTVANYFKALKEEKRIAANEYEINRCRDSSILSFQYAWSRNDVTPFLTILNYPQ